MDTTASGLERTLECPGSEVLSKVCTRSDYADRGNDLHGFVRKVSRGVPIADAIVHVAERWRTTAMAIDFRKLTMGLSQIRSERAFAIDTETQIVRFLGEDIGRRYPERTRAEFAGTEDIGAVRYDKMPVTIDIKTGWDTVSSPDENPQVKFFAVRAHLETGANQVDGRIAYIRESGSVHFDAHVFSRMEMEDFLDDLSELVPRLEAARAQFEATGTVTVSTGKWCKYCPAATACPAKVGLARYLAGAELAEISAMLTALTPEQRGVAWEKAAEIASILKVVQDGLKDVVKQSGAFLTRGGRKQVKEITFPQARFVQERAIELLHKLGAPREEIDSCYSTTQISKVQEVNAPAPPGEKKKSRKKLVA